MDAMCTIELDAPLRDLYRKKTLAWRRMGRQLALDVPADVFSSFQVDLGTERLLRRIGSCGRKWNSVLDLGCGYGPIALHMAARGAAEHVEAVDRDALAVAFTAHNARQNRLDQVAARGRIAYDLLPEAAYDAVVTNLPAKAGRGVHEFMLLGAQRHLRAGGEVWMVAVEPLAGTLDEILAVDAVTVRERTVLKGHVVYNVSFSGSPPVPAEPYVRERRPFAWKRYDYTMTALHGLGEFDKRSWATDLMLDVFHRQFAGKAVGSLLVGNPGQGHGAVVAAMIARSVEEINAVSRDLIALKATAANLSAAGYRGTLRCIHAVDLSVGAGARPDVALILLHRKEGLDVNVEKLRRLRVAGAGCVIVAGRTALTRRLLDRLGAFGIRGGVQKRRKGFCAALLR